MLLSLLSLWIEYREIKVYDGHYRWFVETDKIFGALINKFYKSTGLSGVLNIDTMELSESHVTTTKLTVKKSIDSL